MVPLFGRTAMTRQTRPPLVTHKYNKNYIGLALDGVAANFAVFKPRRQHVAAEFKIPRSEEVTQRLEDEGMDLLAYSSQFGLYRLHINREDLELRTSPLRELIKQAHDAYGL